MDNSRNGANSPFTSRFFYIAAMVLELWYTSARRDATWAIPINREKSWLMTIIARDMDTSRKERSIGSTAGHAYLLCTETRYVTGVGDAGEPLGVTGRMNISKDQSWGASISFFRVAARHELGRSDYSFYELIILYRAIGSIPGDATRQGLLPVSHEIGLVPSENLSWIWRDITREVTHQSYSSIASKIARDSGTCAYPAFPFALLPPSSLSPRGSLFPKVREPDYGED